LGYKIDDKPAKVQMELKIPQAPPTADGFGQISKLPENHRIDVEKGVEAMTIIIDFPLDGEDGLGWRSYKFDA
jgi:hypothetical protein